MRDEFLITRQGKQYVLFAGLLDEAHSRGLRGIDTDLLQIPDDANGHTAIVKASVQMEDGRTFSGLGDASPQNVGRNIAPHVIRMAETRAKARALRDAVNVGATALEELSDGDDVPPNAEPYRQQQRPARPTPIRSEARSQPARAQRAEPEAPEEAAPAENGQADGAAAEEEAGGRQGTRRGAGSGTKGGAKARKSQVDLLKTLAVEWAGESGVERLEKRVGKPLGDLTRAEADEWIDRLTPEGRE